MTRGLHADTIAESDNAVVHPAWFTYLDVAGDPLWACTLRRSPTVTVATDPLLSGGQTFLGMGGVAEVSDMVQADDGTVQEVSMSLLYADFTDEAAADLLNDPTQWSMRAGVVWFGFYTPASGAIVANPFRVMTGRMVHVAAVDGATPGLVVKLRGRAAEDGLRVAGWMLSGAHQETFYAGDRALEFVPQLGAKELRFGQPDTIARVGGGSARIRPDQANVQLF